MPFLLLCKADRKASEFPTGFERKLGVYGTPPGNFRMIAIFAPIFGFVNICKTMFWLIDMQRPTPHIKKKACQSQVVIQCSGNRRIGDVTSASKQPDWEDREISRFDVDSAKKIKGFCFNIRGLKCTRNETDSVRSRCRLLSARACRPQGKPLSWDLIKNESRIRSPIEETDKAVARSLSSACRSFLTFSISL